MPCKSIIDTDLYSFSIGYFYMKNFPDVEGTFEFIDRNNTVYPENFDVLLRAELTNLSWLKLKADEESYLRSQLLGLPNWFFEWLRGYRFDPKGLDVKQDEEGHLSITKTGLLYKELYWEEPILSTVSELYHKMIGDKPDLDYIVENTKRKALLMKENGVKFSDFGTRRRFSYDVHDLVLGTLKEHAGEALIGTSNCYLGFKHNLPSVGTMAHQAISAIGALHGYKYANYNMMNLWDETFNGKFATYLYDTYGHLAFMNNFDKTRALRWDGLRVDSGDNFKAFDMMYDFYKNTLKIKPETINLIFSNNLTAEKAVEIHKYIDGRMNDSYGIGTSFVCDCGNDIKPNNIVMELFKVRKDRFTDDWINCVKLSDDEGKYTGDPEEIQRCLKELNLNNL